MASKRLFPAPSTVRTWRSLTLTIPLQPFPFNVNVSIQTAISDQERLSGHRYCTEHMQQVSMRNHCPECGECEVVTGYEVDDHVVTLTEGEAEALVPISDDVATMSAMVDPLDPIYVDKSYAVWWADDAAAKNYALLAGALKSSGKWLVGTTQLGRTTQAIALRYSESAGTVVAHTLLHDARVRWGHLEAVREGVEGVTAYAELSAEQAEGAALLLSDALADTFDMAKVEDTYDRDLRAAVEAKLAGVEPVKSEKVKSGPPATDLLDALRASMAETKKGQKTETPKFGKRGVLVDVGTPDEAIARAKRMPKREKVKA